MNRYFDAARRAALVSDLKRRLAGRPTHLLPFDEVRETLKLRHFVDLGVMPVPLVKIVGTLGRDREFNRALLPRDEALRDRWQRIARLAEGPKGFPPVDLYKVGEAYFVVDGHHRVSVARAMGAPDIEARVFEFDTPIPITPEESVEEILLKRGLADFLDATGLEMQEPGELTTTIANGYQRLLEHIIVHRYFRSVEEAREIPLDEAASSWYGRVYRPMIESIREHRLTDDFPRRTETDLYLFTIDHLHKLRQQYGDQEVLPAEAVEDYSARRRRRHKARANFQIFWRNLFGTLDLLRERSSRVTLKDDHKRPFGNSGLQVPRLGYGAGWIGEADFSDTEIDRLLGSVLDAGIHLLDTARSYGLSEERIGRFLASRRSGVVLSTKVGYGIPGYEDWTGPCITAGVDAALERLRTDHIDIVHLHSCPLHVLEQGEVTEALLRAVEAGKVGVAAYSGDNEELEYAIASDRFGSVQASVNLCDQRAIDRAIPKASRKEMGFIAKRPVANAPWRFAEPPVGHEAEEYWQRWRELDIDPRELDWHELALRFTVFQPGVHCAIVGTRDLDHLRKNVEIVEQGPLPEDMVQAIRYAFSQRGADWRSKI